MGTPGLAHPALGASPNPPAMAGSIFAIKGSGTNVAVVTSGFVGALALVALDIPYTIAFSKIAVLIQNSTAGNSCDVGIYSEAGQLIANIGPQLAVINSLQTYPLLQGTVTLPAGRYLVCLSGGNLVNSTSLQCFEPQVFDYLYTTASTGMPCPNSITVAKSALTNSGITPIPFAEISFLT
jgi:hypothetical protein